MNRVSLAFAMHDDDHFMGFGERYVYGDHRAQSLYNWVEEDGLGSGEETPIGPSNPSPNGPGQTHIPIPWFMSPRGFGLLLNSTWRSNVHLGEERPDAWRVESTTGTLDVSFFVDPDPRKLVASLTAVTGRPPPIADWVLAPRRRADIGTDETAKLRAAHIATSVIDTAVHYFPNGDGSDHASMAAVTAGLHAQGFKAVAYFCPFVADSWHPVFDAAVANGYLVKKPDGTPYVVLDPPYNAGMVDFTNPAAVAWYQSFLQQAVDDGWDGWMYDFAEYVPQDAVLFNGKSGLEMHNEYPVLYQKAALDFFQAQRPGDFLFFARSGYAGTGGAVPMIWAGDQATDFDLADGLPAALCGALNAGMSGIPLWGSDISGYHYLFNPPPDKELYLRWTEVGAFSADMHDENEGAGTGPSSERWQIWDDQESIDVYRKYALIKTRMLPYVRVAVREARAGTPVMRHLYLTNPTDPRVYQMQDEYFYGDSLLVAPVVARGLTSRSVYLPDAQYFDYWTGARVAGAGDVIAEAPLDTVPVFARMGAIVPMLSPDVETVVPSSDGSVVSMQDRAGFLEVQVFAGGSTSVTLDDGTVLSQSAPTTAFDPGATITHSGAPVPQAASPADLMTCAACFWDDAETGVFSIATVTASDSITAGALTVSVSGSPSVKRYLFTVRHARARVSTAFAFRDCDVARAKTCLASAFRSGRVIVLGSAGSTRDHRMATQAGKLKVVPPARKAAPSLARAEIVDKATRGRFEAELDAALKRRPSGEAKLAGALRAIAPLSAALRASMAEAVSVMIRRKSLDRELYGACMRSIAEAEDRQSTALLKTALAADEAGGTATLSAACFSRDPALAAPLAKIAASRQSHLAFAAEIARVARRESNGAHLAGLAPMIKESHRISLCVELFVPLARSAPIPAVVGPALGVLRGAERHLGRWLVMADVAVRAGDRSPLEEALQKATVGPQSARAAWSLVAWALSDISSPTPVPEPQTRPTVELVARLSDRPSADRDTTFLFRMARGGAHVARPMLETLVRTLPLADDVSIRAALFLARDHARDDMREALVEAATVGRREELRGLAVAAMWDAAGPDAPRDRARALADELLGSKSLANAAWATLVRAAARTKRRRARTGSATSVTETPFRWIQWGWLE